MSRDTPAPAVSSSCRTVQIGTCQDEEAMRAALEAAGCRVGLFCSEMLQQVKYSPEVRTINLVWLRGYELGLGDWDTVEKVHDRGLERGLELCEWEDGPQLAAQYPGQLYGEVIHMAMKPIMVAFGGLRLFAVVHDSDGRWLDGCYCGMGGWCAMYKRFAFRCK